MRNRLRKLPAWFFIPSCDDQDDGGNCMKDKYERDSDAKHRCGQNLDIRSDIVHARTATAAW